MSSFDAKLISTWKIGISKWKVKQNNNDKIMEDCDGLCVPQEKTIYMRKECYKNPAYFLEVLLHELHHAIDEMIAINNHEKMRELLTKQTQFDEHEDMMVELRTRQSLTLFAENIGNFRYILNYLEKNM